MWTRRNSLSIFPSNFKDNNRKFSFFVSRSFQSSSELFNLISLICRFFTQLFIKACSLNFKIVAFSERKIVVKPEHCELSWNTEHVWTRSDTREFSNFLSAFPLLHVPLFSSESLLLWNKFLLAIFIYFARKIADGM